MAVKELFFRFGGLHLPKMSVYFWIIHNWHKNNVAIMAVKELFFRFWVLYKHEMSLYLRIIQILWYHLQVWIWMLKDNHEIGVKIVIGNSRILIGKRTRSQHWQLNSYSFVFGDTIAFVATLHLLKLASFLTSCAIVNPKTKESLFNCSCLDLAIWTKTILRGYKCTRCKCICGGAFWSRLVDGT